MNLKFKPKIIHIDLTGKCNFRCLHCRGRVDENNHISKEKVIDILTQINTNWGDEVEWIELGGGEPLLYPYLYEIIEFIKKNTKMKIILVSNAYFCNLEKLKKLKEIGLDRIQFSLDSYKKETHNYIRQNKLSYDKVVEASQNCVLLNIPFVLRLTIMNINKDDIEDFFKFAKDLGADEVGLRGCIYMGYANLNEKELFVDKKEYFKILEQLPKYSEKYNIHYFSGDPLALAANKSLLQNIKDNYGTFNLYAGCSVGISYMYFNNDGNVAFCPMLNDIIIGDTNTTSIIDIWNNSKDYNIMRNRKFEGNCKDCELIQLCGGCRAYSYWETGELYKGNLLCMYNKNDK